LCVDGAIAFASVAVSFALRFDLAPVVTAHPGQLLLAGAASLFIKPVVLLVAGVYSIYWQYVSSREVLRLLWASVAASLALAILVVFLVSLGPLRGIPGAILVTDFLVTTVAVSCVRLAMHLRQSGRKSLEGPM
jgi:FlaA1/EpsC-like NDP-sugar epimerase